MLRVLLATALAVLATAVAALAAPALDPRPYIPAPVEFELRAPAAPPRAAAAGRGFVAPPVRAAKRFNLVGLSWNGDAEAEVAIRARMGDGRWTPWTPASRHDEHSPDEGRGERTRRASSEPVWVGEGEWVQYRISKRVPGLRLHFVNTTGTATAKDRAINRLRGVANAAVAHVANAWASTGGPRIRTRAEWGANRHCMPRSVAYGQVRAAIIHHTVTANGYTKAQTPAAILAICRFHRNTNGWSDIGYNFIVDRFGRIWEGRAGGVDEAVAGAHAQGYNSQTTGIANLGTFSSQPQSDAAIGGMARLIRWKMGTHGLKTHGRPRLRSAGGSAARYPAGVVRRFDRISGHSDTGRTECPGLQLYRQLPDLRERVGERRPPGSPVQVDAPVPEAVTYSHDGISFGGRIVDVNGSPVSGVEMELQRLARLGWRTLSRATSNGNGNFGVVRKFKRRPVLRWKFAGDDTHRAFRGDGAPVAVAPLISLSGSARRIEPGQTVRLTGTIMPRRTTAQPRLVVEVLQNGVWQPAGDRNLKPKKGRIARNWRFDNPGQYRVSVQFPGDARNAPSASPYVEVSVEQPLFGF